MCFDALEVNTVNSCLGQKEMTAMGRVCVWVGWWQRIKKIFNKKRCEIVEKRSQTLAPSIPVQLLIPIYSFSIFSICHSVNQKKNWLLPRWQLRLLMCCSVDSHCHFDDELQRRIKQWWIDGAACWIFTTVNYKYTHNFLMSTRLYINAIDLKKPTKRVEKQINKYLVESVYFSKALIPLPESEGDKYLTCSYDGWVTDQTYRGRPRITGLNLCMKWPNISYWKVKRSQRPKGTTENDRNDNKVIQNDHEETQNGHKQTKNHHKDQKRQETQHKHKDQKHWQRPNMTTKQHKRMTKILWQYKQKRAKNDQRDPNWPQRDALQPHKNTEM